MGFRPGWPDIVGVAGTGLVVLAFFLTQARRMDATGVAFPMLNLAGSLLICVSLWFSFNLASAVMELFWVAISVFGIAQALRRWG